MSAKTFKIGTQTKVSSRVVSKAEKIREFIDGMKIDEAITVDDLANHLGFSREVIRQVGKPMGATTFLVGVDGCDDVKFCVVHPKTAAKLSQGAKV